MSLLSDFIISKGPGVPAYDGDPDFPANDRVQLDGITPLEAGALLAALRGGGDSVELISEFPLLTPQEGEAWTMGVSDDFVERLAALDAASIPYIAGSFADLTVEELGWSADEALPMVADLAALARRARSEGMRMFLWNSL